MNYFWQEGDSRMVPIKSRKEHSPVVNKYNFYNTFISVVFGFLTYMSIQLMAEQLSTSVILLHEWALFIGLIIIIIHFWLVCVASDSIEDRVYSLADRNAPSRLFNLFGLIAILLSTALACPLLVMVYSCFTGALLFWRAFIALCILSLGYDIIAVCFSLIALIRVKTSKDQRNVKEFARIYGKWLILDLVLLCLAFAFYHTVSSGFFSVRIVSIIFLLVGLVGILIDVIVLHPEMYTKV
jgi:cytochrome b561